MRGLPDAGGTRLHTLPTIHRLLRLVLEHAGVLNEASDRHRRGSVRGRLFDGRFKFKLPVGELLAVRTVSHSGLRGHAFEPARVGALIPGTSVLVVALVHHSLDRMRQNGCHVTFIALRGRAW